MWFRDCAGCSLILSLLTRAQNGKVVGRVNGASAAELTQKVSALAKTVAATATVSATAAAGASPPAKKAAAAPASTAAPVELTPELKARLQSLLKSAKCLAFIKGTPEQPRCGFTRQVLELFVRNNVEFSSFNILEDEVVRQGLKLYSDWPTFPQVRRGD